MYKNIQNSINKLLLISIVSITVIKANTSIIDSIGTNIGYAYMPYSHSGNKPDNFYSKNFLDIEIYSVFNTIFNNNSYKPTINYIYNTNNQFDNHTLLFGLNKYFFFKKKDIYVGPLLGYGQLKWDKKIVNNTLSNDLKAESFIGGIQSGIELFMSEHLSFNINSKLLLHSYNMKIEDSSIYKANYLHSYTASISIGINYSFNSHYVKKIVIEHEPSIENKSYFEPKTPAKITQKKAIVKEAHIEQPKRETIIKEEPKRVVAVEKEPIVFVALDTDNDGIDDTKDKCSNTPQNFSVDENGCVKLFTINIKFSYKSNKIPHKYDRDINKLANFLRKNKEYNAQINAYTDNIGSKKYNIRLSKKRAKALYKKLRAYYIDENRLKYSGLGESSPIASNKTEKGREKNRRLEVLLIKE